MTLIMTHYLIQTIIWLIQVFVKCGLGGRTMTMIDITFTMTDYRLMITDYWTEHERSDTSDDLGGTGITHVDAQVWVGRYSR